MPPEGPLDGAASPGDGEQPQVLPVRRLALLLEYDGSGFSGSQVQPGRRTVQGTLEEALRALTGEAVRVSFAGRTDAGVHAEAQVASVLTRSPYPSERVAAALNALLPPDVAVRRAQEVSPDFDPRRHAVARVYRYRIVDGRPRAPLDRQRAWHRRGLLETANMAEAAETLPLGICRDWAAFAGPVPPGYPTVRTVRRCEVRRLASHRLTIEMEADGFLPHQVRRTVGALVRVGAGTLDVAAFGRLVDGPPGSAGPAAPPQGLTLVAVRYARGTVDWDDGDEDVPAQW